MRILFLVDGYFPGIGGAELQAKLLAETLIAKGHAVQFVAPHLETHLPLEHTWEGLPIKRIAYPHIPKLSNILYMCSFALYILKHGKDYDAIHIHMVHKMAFITGLFKGFLGIPVLAKVSGATEFEGGVFDYSSNQWYKKLTRRVLRRIDYYQSLSSFSKEQIVKAGIPEEQVINLANGLDVNRFSLSKALHSVKQSDKTIIAYCGRFEPVKALPILFTALAQIKEQGNDNFLLRLAGDGSEEDNLTALVASLGLNAHVEFCGRIDDVPGFLNQAHVYTQVSRYEGLSNSVIEAMCCGLAPVLTRISGNEDLVVHGESGYLIAVDDVDALAQHLNEILLDREKCRQLGAKARERVESLCALDVVVETLESVYDGSYSAAPEQIATQQQRAA